MTRHCLACVLVWGLAFPPGVYAAAAGDAAPAQKLGGVFLALDAAKARVTYRSDASGAVITSPVPSPAIVKKLARIRSGQEVILTCRPRGNEVLVEDVKKKPNWWKRGIILAVITLGVVSLATSDSDNLGL